MMLKLFKNIPFAFIVVFITIFITDDTLLFGTNSNTLFVTGKYIVLILLTIYLIFCSRKISINAYSLTACMTMCYIVIMSSLVNDDFRAGTIFKCIILLLSYYITKRLSFSDYIKYFMKVMYFVSLVSICFMVIFTLKFDLLSFAPTITNSANLDFYNFLFFIVPTNPAGLRNYGVFREPGVFQMFIVLALIFLLYFSQKIRLKYFFVFSIALVMTFSTTGFVAYFLCLVIFFSQSDRLKIPVKTLRKIGFFFIIGLIFLVLKTDIFSSDSIVFGKLNNKESHSTIARYSSITNSYNIWLSHPLLGAGLQKTDDLTVKQNIKKYGFASTNTNTIMSELAVNGIFYIILFMLGIIKFINKCGYSFVDKLCFFLIILILSAGEKLCFSPFFYILIFYGWSLKKSSIERNILS